MADESEAPPQVPSSTHEEDENSNGNSTPLIVSPSEGVEEGSPAVENCTLDDVCDKAEAEDEPPEVSVIGAQVVLVNRLVKTIGRLRTANALLEMKITDSDTHNKVLQLQIDIMMKKMDMLEGFVTQVKQMDEDGIKLSKFDEHGLCRMCKKKIDSSRGENVSSPGLELEDALKEFTDSDDEFQNENYSTHSPLMIDIVVGNVFSYLPLSTLVKCRLVNRLWCQEASYILKQRQWLTINQLNIDRLPKLLELANSRDSISGSFLFRRVKFDIGFLVKTHRQFLDEFFIQHGSKIHYFSFHCEQENSPALYMEEMRNLFLPYLTHVETLELSVPTKVTERQTLYDDMRPQKFLFGQLTTLKLRHMDSTLDIGGYTVPVMKEILNATPKLKCLYVETHTKEVVTRILQALNEKECRSVTNQLEELYLDAFITEEHLRYLLPLDFKLKTLQLSYFTLEVTSAMFEALLSKQRTTLETLIIGDYKKRTTENSLPLIVKLPVLRELKHLKFVDPLFPDHRQVMLNPLNFSEQLPSLQQISFDHETGKPAGPHYFQDIFVCSPKPCLTLNTLRISHGLSEAQLVTSAAKMFPNLTKLEIANVPDCVIQGVWKEFTGIKILYLFLNPTNLNIDSLMTGVPDQVCRRIQEKNLFSQVDMMNALDIIRTEPAICNLAQLETLRIDGYTSSLLTAVTGYLALCQMKSLCNISIKADVITLSRECRRVLGEKLHLSSFDIF